MPIGLDGVNQFVDLGNPAVFPDGSNPRSMVLWVRPTTLSGVETFFTYGTASTNQAMGLWRSGTACRAFGFNNDMISANFFTTVNQWYHVALTFDGTTARLYKNGSEVLSANKSAWNLVRSVAYIGQFIVGGDYWQGQIDDVRLYSRVPSADEIEEIHDLKGKDRRDNGLVFGARLNEFGPGVTIPDTAGILRDRSGNDNHGTPVNTPTGAEGILSFGRMVT